jgi:hypothetical protein
MMTSSFRVCTLFGAAAVTIAAQTATFQHEVLPLFQAKCIKCHGGGDPMAGLDLRTVTTIVAGSKKGPVVAPGRPDESKLLHLIEKGMMPPGDRMSAGEVAVVRQWIKTGQFPSKDEAVRNAKPGGITEEARNFWSFRKPMKTPIPKVGAASRVRTPVDAFVLQALERKGLPMNPDVDRAKLIRRVYFDLIGLPPSPEEVRAFVQDEDAHSYEKLVDNLLSSPQHGVRWARHWLDVGGYTDYSIRSYKYRDWVIRAFNSDKPYDEFVREQLAGDQIANYKFLEKPTADQVEKLIATGYLRLAHDLSDNQKIYQDDKYWDTALASMEWSIKGVLGLTVGCARCHDHKFDPILQKDYYKLLASYRPAYDTTRWLAGNAESGNAGPWPSRLIPIADKAEVDKWDELLKAVYPKTRELRRAQSMALTEYRTQWRQTEIAKLPEIERTELRLAEAKPAGERTAHETELLKRFDASHKIGDDDLEKLYPELAKKLQELKAQADANTKTMSDAAPDFVWGLWDMPLPATPTRILRRGNYMDPGEVVEPGIPEVFDDPKSPLRFPDPEPSWNHTGRRLALAKWITEPNHPLTARVWVNRVWKHHFGVGIVKTLDDFGTQGARPSHPELLDWLAVSFVENGWSTKWLHRQIVLSSAYRQSSEAQLRGLELDPEARMLWRKTPRRLEAEAIRDSILAVSGQLDPAIGGPPTNVQLAADGQYVVDADATTQRRSLFLRTKRTAALGFLWTFDMPTMEVTAPDRFSSAVPQQALALMNSDFLIQSAMRLSERVAREAGADPVKRIRITCELAWGRLPTEQEVSLVLRAIQKDEDPAQAWRSFSQAVLGSNQFLYVD